MPPSPKFPVAGFKRLLPPPLELLVWSRPELELMAPLVGCTGVPKGLADEFPALPPRPKDRDPIILPPATGCCSLEASMGSMSFSIPSISRSSTPAAGGSDDSRVESWPPAWRRGGEGPWLWVTPPSEVVPEVGGGVGPGAVVLVVVVVLVLMMMGAVVAVVVERAKVVAASDTCRTTAVVTEVLSPL